MRLIDLLKRSGGKYPDRIAIRDNSSAITYAELLSEVEQIHDHLKAVGCGPGMKVAIVLPNSAVYVAGFFAVSAAGATIVPMTSRMTVYEIGSFIERAAVSIVLTGSGLARRLAGQWQDKAAVTIVTAEQSGGSVLKLRTLITGRHRPDDDDHDVALMVYTSGTTGQAKIVMLTDDQLISNMFIYRAVMDFEGSQVVYCALLFHHIYCICAQLLTHISRADTFIIKDCPFFIKDFFQAVASHQVTSTAFVPYMARLMAEYPQSDQFDLSSLKYITISGAKTPVPVYQKLTRRFGQVKFICTYGMSEAGSRISIAAPEPAEFPAESVGRPVPGVTVRITDEHRNVLPAGAIGEIEVKGCGVFKGYFGQPAVTAETMADGWLRTGDLGQLDDRGNLYLAGRKKELILCGGENILPAEIEEVLLNHGAIREAVVIGLPDDRLDEVPCAFVVSSDGFREAEVVDFCRRRLSSFKVPRRVFFTRELPKLGTAKIDRARLREIALGHLHEGV